MRRDRLADHGAVAGDEVEHTGGEADLVDDLGEDERAQRCHLARLQHHRAAGGERRRDLGHDLVQRVVPRCDAPHDADRLVDHEGVADLLLERELADDLGERAHDHGRQPGLDHHRQVERHAHLGGDDVGDVAHARAQPLLQPLEVLGPLLDRRRGPREEGRPRRRHRVVDVGCRALRNGADDLLGGGTDDVDGALPGGWHPRPVDVQPRG